jgi:hypothetical protein
MDQISPVHALVKDRKASLSARREGIVVSQLKTVLNEKFRAIVNSDFLL